MKKLAIILGTFFIFTAAVAGLGFGVGKAQAADDCSTITPDELASVEATQANITQELTLRKQLLSQTIACATSDAETLQETLNAIPLPSGTNGAAQAIQSQLAGKITDAINFYNLENTKLDGAGVSATESIASEMLSWRASNYAPLDGDVNNFALWSSNQLLFETAQNRLTQTERVVAFIDNATVTNGDLESALSAAQSSFTDAQNENTAAGVALASAQSPDVTLGLIQQSLQSLADTYQKFTDLNTLIQPLLPT